jgi:hypothetical protein
MISFHQNKISVIESVSRVVNFRPQSLYRVYRVSSAQHRLSHACKDTPYIMGHQEMSDDKFCCTLLNTVSCCLCYEFIPAAVLFRLWWLIICWCHLSYVYAYVSELHEIIECLFLISQQKIRLSDFCKGLNYAVNCSRFILYCVIYTLSSWKHCVSFNRNSEVRCRVEFALEM